MTLVVTRARRIMRRNRRRVYNTGGARCCCGEPATLYPGECCPGAPCEFLHTGVPTNPHTIGPGIRMDVPYSFPHVRLEYRQPDTPGEFARYSGPGPSGFLQFQDPNSWRGCNWSNASAETRVAAFSPTPNWGITGLWVLLYVHSLTVRDPTGTPYTPYDPTIPGTIRAGSMLIDGGIVRIWVTLSARTDGAGGINLAEYRYWLTTHNGIGGALVFPNNSGTFDPGSIVGSLETPTPLALLPGGCATGIAPTAGTMNHTEFNGFLELGGDVTLAIDWSRFIRDCAGGESVGAMLGGV